LILFLLTSCGEESGNNIAAPAFKPGQIMDATKISWKLSLLRTPRKRRRHPWEVAWVGADWCASG
jgi:hypothetical protein